MKAFYFPRLSHAFIRCSVKVDSKCDYYDKDSIVFERDIGNIIGVFVPRAPTLHFYALPIILTHCRLHDVLVPLVLLTVYKCFLSLDTDLPGENIFPVFFVGSSLPSLLFLLTSIFFLLVVVILFVLIIRLLYTSVSLLVLSHQIGYQLLDSCTCFSWSELCLERWSYLVLCLCLRSVLIHVLHSKSFFVHNVMAIWLIFDLLCFALS